MAERNDFAALGLDLIAGSGIRLEDTEDGLIIISTSGGGGSLGNYAGRFDATTVKQQAFDANDYILFDDGTRQEVFLAPEAIPANSPAPGENGALWGAFTALITSGISAADLTNRLASYVLKSALTTMLGDYVLQSALTNQLSNYVLNSALTTALNEKADASALANYVRTSALAAALSGKADTSALANFLHTSTFNIEKARLESGITGNDNDIAALMQSLQNLQTQVNNLMRGEVGEGVTTAALNSAIDTLRKSLQANIDALTAQVGNIPVASEVLWATSKTLATSIPAGTIDTDWTLGDRVPAGVVVDGDILDIPKTFRGELHVEMFNAADELLERRAIQIEVGQESFNTPFGNRFRANIAQDARDAGVLNFTLQAASGRAVSIPAGSVCKVYGVTALPRSQVDAVTQAYVDTAVAKVDDKFGGVPLNGPDAGESISLALVDNLNASIPQSNWATVPVFNGVNLLRDAIPAGASFRDLGQYDRILIRITFFTGSLSAVRRTQSTDFFVSIAEWDALKTVPNPNQAIAEDETNRIGIIASTADNRALVHEFPQVAPSDVSVSNALRNSKRLIYVGKSNETNPRLLLALSGTNQDFLAEVKGYH